MEESVLQLYPLPGREVSLKGLYLAHELYRKQQTTVYSNFISSLDGRIALPHLTQQGLTVPAQIANPRDWRLYQELAIQADVIIVSGRYMREYASGKAGDIITVYDDPELADLKDWRADKGLSRLPALAVVSGSLDFTLPDILAKNDQKVFVITGTGAEAAQVKALEEQHAKVIVVGESRRVDGAALVRSLSDQGYHSIYSAAGPGILHTLLEANVLDRLYLTFANRILGGKDYATIVGGSVFDPPVDLRLSAMYIDNHALDGAGQVFGCYDRLDKL